MSGSLSRMSFTVRRSSCKSTITEEPISSDCSGTNLPFMIAWVELSVFNIIISPSAVEIVIVPADVSTFCKVPSMVVG